MPGYVINDLSDAGTNTNMHKLSDRVILKLDGVSYSHPDPKGFKGTPTLKGINLRIAEGEIISIIGPSGSGKSTLLRLLNRLYDPDSGEIYYKDKPLTDYPILNLRREILLVNQEPYIAPGTIADNLSIAKKDGKVTKSEMLDVLTSVNLQDKELSLDSQRLSVGEKHRLALARAFLLKPSIILLDEPAASLDLQRARAVVDTVGSLHEKFNLTVVMVTHRFRLARRLGGIIALLIDGTIVEKAPSEEFFHSPQTDSARIFLEGQEDDT